MSCWNNSPEQQNEDERRWIRENPLIRFENYVHEQRKNQLLKLVDEEYEILKLIEDSGHSFDRKEEMRKTVWKELQNFNFDYYK